MLASVSFLIVEIAHSVYFRLSDKMEKSFNLFVSVNSELRLSDRYIADTQCYFYLFHIFIAFASLVSLHSFVLSLHSAHQTQVPWVCFNSLFRRTCDYAFFTFIFCSLDHVIFIFKLLSIKPQLKTMSPKCLKVFKKLN